MKTLFLALALVSTTHIFAADSDRLPLGGVCFCGTYSANNRKNCSDYVNNLAISSTDKVILTGSCTEQMNDFSKCNGAYCSLFEGFAVVLK